MFTLHRYINQSESRWDQFVLSGNNGTLFHLRKFLNYHPKDRFQDHSILIEKKQNLFSVLPAAELIVDGKEFWSLIRVRLLDHLLYQKIFLLQMPCLCQKHWSLM